MRLQTTLEARQAFLAAAAAGELDAMGLPLADWQVALLDENGLCVRDEHLRVVYVTQTEWRALQAPCAPAGACPPALQQELFA